MYKYDVSDTIKQYFHHANQFFIEYSQDVSEVPKSIANIPFICNVLPIAWVTNSEIVISELDKDFYDNIEKIKQGYINMYPKLKFSGKLTVKKIVDNSYEPSDKSATFFSGGVDSFSTLISHIDEQPTLITVWGSDVFFDDQVGWNNVNKHALEVGQEFNCKNLFIKSSFRYFLDEGALSNLVYPKANDGWWHGFQHGIGLIGHAAPVAWLNKWKNIYFASTFTENEKGKVTCASDPTIDNNLFIASCQTIHDGYQFTRQDKLKNICDYKKQTNKNIQLRVCWESKGGGNCCHCEKCYRTIYGLLAEKANPNEFGFEYEENLIDRSKNEIKYKFKLENDKKVMWQDIQRKFNENPSLVKSIKGIKWIYDWRF